MARKPNDDLLMEDELAAAFLTDDDIAAPSSPAPASNDDSWDEGEGDFPGQLAVDAYETEDKLVIKARTAGIDRNDLDVSISDGILTISGTLSSGDDTEVRNWHIQECYWGEFSRSIALPVPVKEDDIEAVLKDVHLQSHQSCLNVANCFTGPAEGTKDCNWFLCCIDSGE